MKSIKLPFKLLIYDIETSLMKADIFRLGEQVVRHNQLDPSHDSTQIICIAAKWYGQKQIFVFDGSDAVEQFDKLAREADVCMGKNSDRFDVKHINTQRMLQGLQPFPEWMDSSDDLEKQFRRFFTLPSMSLDYISKIFGDGGKEKMDFSDWQDISKYKTLLRLDKAARTTNNSFVLFGKSARQVLKAGQKALKKMIHYNKKDVTDTESALRRVLPYIKLKHNAASRQEGKGCTTCGSLKIVPIKVIIKGQTKYQQFHCEEHNGYAGRATYKYDRNRHKVFGKMQS